MHRTILPLIVFALTGCISAQDQARNQAQQDQADAAVYRQRISAQCQSYGYTQDTDEFRKCLKQVDVANRLPGEAHRQMLIQKYLQQQDIFRR